VVGLDASRGRQRSSLVASPSPDGEIPQHSVSFWDKIVGTRVPSAPSQSSRAGHQVWSRTHTLISRLLRSERSQGHVAVQVPRAGPVPIGFQVQAPPHGRCPHTRSSLGVLPKVLHSPLLLKDVAQSRHMWVHCLHVICDAHTRHWYE
jgi:hypothetical protein